MSSSVIPKEKLTAFERYEMASFHDDRAEREARAAEEKRVAEELTQLREQARQQGYAEGQSQGHKAGMDAGRAEAARETARLKKIADSFAQEINKASDTVAEEMLSLALDLSKAILKTALNTQPELMLGVVREAISYLPSVQQPAQLFLHPDDAKLVRTQMASELESAGWKIAEDKQIARGGCRVETASNQIDATIETRWQRLAETLGRQSDWLA